AGLAATGRIVVAATFAVFASMRAAEMIRTSICYPRLNVKVVGGYAGLTNGKDGATHQSVEDLAIMRSFPNMTVLVPSDPVQARKVLRAAVAHDGPVYIRVEYGNLAPIYSEDFDFEIGRGVIVRKGADVTIASCGIALARVLEVAETLAAEGIEVEVLDIPTLKPFDKVTLLTSVGKTGALVTVEEHSVIGGLASAAAETLLEAHACPYFKGLGIPDVFTESGTSEKLRDKYGIGRDAIQKAVRGLVAAKKEGRQK
ncbi:MAG: transketolase family protein, partial [Firmicutes bacterium]|nr:transketolase family protein [Bacillota bacterium]